MKFIETIKNLFRREKQCCGKKITPTPEVVTSDFTITATVENKPTEVKKPKVKKIVKKTE